MGNFRYLLYAACLVSLSVYAYRAYRRWLAPDRHERRAEREAAATTPSEPETTPAGRRAVDPVKAPRPATRSFGFTDPSSLPSQREADAGESLVQQVIREEVAKQRGLDPTEAGSAAAGPASDTGPNGRSGLFASGSSASPDRVSVAAALTGVRLPEDLVPLVDGSAVDPHHVLFLAASGPAAGIGRHLGDELERLGFEVRSEGDAVAVATKGAVRLRITLHPDAGTERVGGEPRWPTAPPASVVVEFET